MGFLSSLFGTPEVTAPAATVPTDDSKLRQAIAEAVADGVVNEAEAVEIAAVAASMGIPEWSVNSAKAVAFMSRADEVMGDGELTEEEFRELEGLASALAIPDDFVGAKVKELAAMRRLSRLRAGDLPVLQVTGLVLKKGEVVHWAQPAVLLEQRVIKKKWESGFSSMSFRLAPGVTWRVGGTKGHLVPVSEVVRASTGWLLISNKRLVFRGNQKSFQYALDELMEYGFYQDGMRITPNNGDTRTVQFTDSDVDMDVTGLILSYVIDNYEKNLFGR